MYNKNYYPTPDNIIRKMLEPHMSELKTASILEPSAGMGAICDFLKWNGAKQSRIFTCENDPNMKAALTGKGYKVIHENFLTYSGSMNFDLIVMNPPFDMGADHLLKAWNIIRTGHIVCLLNAETLENPYTQSRMDVAKLVQDYGSATYLGDCFQSAARKTGVNVVMVRLNKKTAQSGASFNMPGTDKMEEIDLSTENAELEKVDYISALVRSYEKTIESTGALYKAMMEFKLFSTVFSGEYGPQKLCTQFFETATKYGYSEAHNEFVLAFQRHAWDMIFRKTKAADLMTEKVKEKFNKWREDMGGIDVNEENICTLFDALIQQRKLISDECVVEVFDKLTYHSEKNRQLLGEAWKTNSAYMVAEKFILPSVVEVGWSGRLSLSHGRWGRDFLNDVDRALCMVTGKTFSPVTMSDGSMLRIKTTVDAIVEYCNDHTNPMESEFFTFQLYKKGSGHFKFKDEAVRREFNRRACEKKGWQLPEEEMFRGKSRR